MQIIQLFINAQIKLGKSPIFPAEPLNYFSVSFQVSVPFTYAPGIQPISMTSSEPAAGSFSVVSGWGVLYLGDITPSLQLQAVEVDITSRAACNDAYTAYSATTENMICAAVSDGDKDFCSGESGDPLVVDGKLVGIVSWGLSCSLSYFPGVYSNVAILKSF